MCKAYSAQLEMLSLRRALSGGGRRERVGGSEGVTCTKTISSHI